MDRETLKALYEADEDFREYVDRYCREKYKIDPDGALDLKVMRETAAKYLRWRKVND